MQNQNILRIINDYFQNQKLADLQIFNILRLYIYKLKSAQYNSDLHILAKLLSPTDLRAVIDYYNGDVIKIPSKAELLDCTFLSICFYLKEIQGWGWQEIKQFIDLPEEHKDLLSSISIGKQINSLKENIGKEVMEMIRQLDVEKLKDFNSELK